MARYLITELGPYKQNDNYLVIVLKIANPIISGSFLVFAVFYPTNIKL